MADENVLFAGEVTGHYFRDLPSPIRAIPDHAVELLSTSGKS